MSMTFRETRHDPTSPPPDAGHAPATPAQEIAILDSGASPTPVPFAQALAARLLIEARLDRIIHDLDQPRKTFDPASLRELADNADRHGLLHPIHLRQLADGRLMIITGARRYEAFKLLGRATIPAFVHDEALAPRQLRMIQISENLLAEGVNPIEQAIAFQECLQDGGTATQLAKEFGVAVSTVTRALDLLRQIPPDVQEKIRQKKLPSAIVRVLKNLPDNETKSRFATLLSDGRVKTLAELQAAIKATKSGNGHAAGPGNFTCREEGVTIAVTLPGQDLAAAETALRTLLKDLREQGGKGLGHFKDFLAKKANLAAKASAMQAAQDALTDHAARAASTPTPV
jgi:ParB/RepB/Spo0J family partition protein